MTIQASNTLTITNIVFISAKYNKQSGNIGNIKVKWKKYLQATPTRIIYNHKSNINTNKQRNTSILLQQQQAKSKCEQCQARVWKQPTRLLQF